MISISPNTIKTKALFLSSSGFTLVEMAIVLVIVGLLLGGLLMPLSTQIENQRTSETQKYLDQIKDALLGYAAANGRLPCPATATSNGVESFCTNATGACGAAIIPPAAIPAHGRCNAPYNGFLPAVTLGMNPVNNTGFAIDSWNTPIRYAVTSYYDSVNLIYPFTALNGMRTTTIATLATQNLLYACTSSTGITATTCGVAANTQTGNAPIVIYSLGKNAATGGTGLDEAANPNPNSANNDLVFISHSPATSTAANGEFDDIVTWISPNTLYNRMISAGNLP